MHRTIALSPLFKFILLVLTLATISACSDTQPSSEEPLLRPVRTYEVGSSESAQRRSFPGVVDANQKATLSFRVTGKLSEIAIKEGAPVTKNQVLAKVDDSDFQIELSEAQASFDKAKADFDRAKLLIEKGYVSKADFEKLKSQEASAKANLDAAKQKVAYSELKAPFAGEIAKIYVDNFQEVSASQAVFLIQDLTSLEITVDLPSSVMVNGERDRSKIELFAEFDVIPNSKIPLSIKEVATAADEVTQTYAVTMGMDNVEGYSILPGMTATVTAYPKKALGSDGRTQDIVVPSQSVLGLGSEAYVWVAMPAEGNEGVIEKAAVKVGEVFPGGLQILDGLEVGQRIVTAGMSKLTDGQRVVLSKGQGK